MMKESSAGDSEGSHFDEGCTIRIVPSRGDLPRRLRTTSFAGLVQCGAASVDHAGDAGFLRGPGALSRRWHSLNPKVRPRNGCSRSGIAGRPRPRLAEAM